MTGFLVAQRVQRTVFRMRSPWAGLEILLIAAALACGALWLAVPDLNGVEIALSGSLALGGVLAFAWAQSYVLILARRSKGQASAAWVGGALLLGLGLLYWLVSTFFDVGQLQDASRATDWSRPFGGGERSVLVFMRLQKAAWALLHGALLAALLPFAMEGAAAGVRGAWWRRALSCLRRPFYWAAALSGAAVASVVTVGLMSVRPHLPVLLEILLAVAKVATIFALCAGVVCFVISLAGTYLRDAERARGEVPAARPSSARRRRRQTEPAR